MGQNRAHAIGHVVIEGNSLRLALEIFKKIENSPRRWGVVRMDGLVYRWSTYYEYSRRGNRFPEVEERDSDYRGLNDNRHHRTAGTR